VFKVNGNRVRGLKAGLAAWLLGMWLPALAADITAYAEEWPPYNFTDQAEARGISTDILRALCEKTKLSCDISIVPWARAYRTVQTEPNTLIFTIARKPSREAEFLWIGPILPRATWVYTRPELAPRLKSIKDLAAYRVGVVRDEAAQQDLAAAGIPDKAFVVAASNRDVLRMLEDGMVDAMVDTEVGMAWNLAAATFPAHTANRFMKLTEDGAYYFAMNLKSDPLVVGRLQVALNTLRREKKLDAIVKSYTLQKN